MGASYDGMVEVGPHWSGSALFESVAHRMQLAAEAYVAIGVRGKLAADNPHLFPKIPQKEAEAAWEEETARAQGVYDQRSADLWEAIMPATRHAMEALERLEPRLRIWALAMLAGEAIARISVTHPDAQVRARYLSDCILQKVAETFHNQPNTTGSTPL